MSRHTPWSKQNSTLPSDRIKPTIKGTPNVAKPKGKSKQQQPEDPPKTKEVRHLETLLAALKSTTGKDKDPAGGCFCLARTHALSSYAPLCKSCGLILCSVNPPQFCCPHCLAVLLAPLAREALIVQLESDLLAQMEKEIADHERAIEEAQRAAGAFPSLTGAPPVAQPQALAAVPPPSRQTHKVMSLTGSRRGGVLVSSYTTTPVGSRPASRSDSPKEPEEKIQRVAPPPSQPPYAMRTPRAQRPWENLLDGAVDYQRPPRLDDGRDDGDGSAKPASRRKRAKAKVQGKENDSNADNRPDS